MGGIGLSVEWFIIGLSPWSDTTSPLWAIIMFHTGMGSFWGTVAMAPHILLDPRTEVAAVRRWFRGSFTVAMVMTYILALVVTVADADGGVRFLVCIGSVILTFLAMNVFYLAYFWCLGKNLPLIALDGGNGVGASTAT
jgi:hypothetical protein